MNASVHSQSSSREASVQASSYFRTNAQTLYSGKVGKDSEEAADDCERRTVGTLFI
jgi:hypothetical protein